jgi:hypothetical protein
MAENPKIKKIKLGENTYDLDLGYKNEKGKARYTVGGLPEGFDFSTEMSVKQIFDKIFFPYAQMVVKDAVLSPSQGTHSIPNYQTLSTVTVPVTKNDTVGLEFYLYDITTSPRRLVKGPLTEADINQDGELIFNNLAESAIKTPKTYSVAYTYLTEAGERSDEQTLGSYTFNLSFSTPSTPTVVAKDASGNTLSSDYKVGQSCTVSKITATVANLNSAVGDDRKQGINEFVLTESHNTTFSQKVNSNTDKKSCDFTLTTAETLAPTYNNLTSGSISYTYKVAGKYNKREVNNETWTTDNSGTTSQGSDTIKFTFEGATVRLSGVSSQTKSKLDPLSVSGLKATTTKKSDKVNSVSLYINNASQAQETIDCTSDTDCTKTTYDTTDREKTFTYSNSICSTTTFQAKANCISGTKTSTSATVTFKAPYCWGWVGNGIYLSSFNNYEDLTALTIKKINLEEGTEWDKNTKTAVIETGNPTGQQKFVFACPKSENAPFSGFNSFTKVADAANFPCFDSFDGNTAADRLVDITFEDGSVVTYQIFVTSSVNGAGTTYKFS